MKVAISRLLFLLAVAVVAVSCQNPAIDSSYIPASEAKDGVYCFNVDFSEKDAEYESFIAMRFKPSAFRDSVVTLDITLKGEGTDAFVERVDFPLYEATADVRIIGRKNAVTDIQWPYRAGIRGGAFAEKWSVEIRPADSAVSGNILGMGFYYIKVQ